MKKFLVPLVVVLLLVMTVVPASAQTEATVGCTVTVENISISVDTPSVAYGVLAPGTESAPSGTITATNDGNVTENFLIRGADTVSWTLASSVGVENEYVHKFSTDSWTSSTALTTSNVSLAIGIGTGGTATFELKLTTPTSTTDYTEQTANVYVVAEAG